MQQRSVQETTPLNARNTPWYGEVTDPNSGTVDTPASFGKQWRLLKDRYKFAALLFIMLFIATALYAHLGKDILIKGFTLNPLLLTVSALLAGITLIWHLVHAAIAPQQSVFGNKYRTLPGKYKFLAALAIFIGTLVILATIYLPKGDIFKNFFTPIVVDMAITIAATLIVLTIIGHIYHIHKRSEPTWEEAVEGPSHAEGLAKQFTPASATPHSSSRAQAMTPPRQAQSSNKDNDHEEDNDATLPPFTPNTNRPVALGLEPLLPRGAAAKPHSDLSSVASPIAQSRSRTSSIVFSPASRDAAPAMPENRTASQGHPSARSPATQLDSSSPAAAGSLDDKRGSSRPQHSAIVTSSPARTGAGISTAPFSPATPENRTASQDYQSTYSPATQYLSSAECQRPKEFKLTTNEKIFQALQGIAPSDLRNFKTIVEELDDEQNIETFLSDAKLIERLKAMTSTDTRLVLLKEHLLSEYAVLDSSPISRPASVTPTVGNIRQKLEELGWRAKAVSEHSAALPYLPQHAISDPINILHAPLRGRADSGLAARAMHTGSPHPPVGAFVRAAVPQSVPLAHGNHTPPSRRSSAESKRPYSLAADVLHPALPPSAQSVQQQEQMNLTALSAALPTAGSPHTPSRRSSTADVLQQHSPTIALPAAALAESERPKPEFKMTIAVQAISQALATDLPIEPGRGRVIQAFRTLLDRFEKEGLPGIVALLSQPKTFEYLKNTPTEEDPRVGKLKSYLKEHYEQRYAESALASESTSEILGPLTFVREALIALGCLDSDAPAVPILALAVEPEKRMTRSTSFAGAAAGSSTPSTPAKPAPQSRPARSQSQAVASPSLPIGQLPTSPVMILLENHFPVASPLDGSAAGASQFGALAAPQRGRTQSSSAATGSKAQKPEIFHRGF